MNSRWLFIMLAKRRRLWRVENSTFGIGALEYLGTFMKKRLDIIDGPILSFENLDQKLECPCGTS
jgi:hypothetical protein